MTKKPADSNFRHTAGMDDSFGHLFESETATVFFGNRLASENWLSSRFPNLQLAFLSQTHSDIVLVDSHKLTAPSGDAHITSASGIALCIRTADCLPIALFDPESRVIACVHAGWRGIEHEIIQKTCAAMARKGARISSIKAWIGPHISRSSFEVGQDVAARLETRYLAAASRFTEERDSALLPHSDSNKAFVDLSKIATTQLRAVGLSTDLIQNLMIDTFTSQEHASYRRDNKDSGRQISLIALHE